jgi:6-pyruvoyltetrahydropterin/6-carboxytetrahydropterin synthase
MRGAPHRIFVAKEGFKFSCAHMTVFPDGTKERLHGHNYRVGAALDLADVSFAKLVDFGPLKAAIRELCGEWRERTLIAAANPHLEIAADGPDELEFRLCGQRYVLPRGDVTLLPLDNLVVEQLAALIAARLADRLRPGWPPGVVTGLEVTVLESEGQGATHYLELAPGK